MLRSVWNCIILPLLIGGGIVFLLLYTPTILVYIENILYEWQHILMWATLILVCWLIGTVVIIGGSNNRA